MNERTTVDVDSSYGTAPTRPAADAFRHIGGTLNEGVLQTSESFWTRLRVEAERGILLGVRVAFVVICVGLALGYLARDYSVTKARAENGQRAYEFLQQAQKAAKPEAAK